MNQEVPSEDEQNLFYVRGSEYWNRLPREFGESLSLEIFQSLDKILGNVLQGALLEQGDLTR